MARTPLISKNFRRRVKEYEHPVLRGCADRVTSDTLQNPYRPQTVDFFFYVFGFCFAHRSDGHANPCDFDELLDFVDRYYQAIGRPLHDRKPVPNP